VEEKENIQKDLKMAADGKKSQVENLNKIFFSLFLIVSYNIRNNIVVRFQYFFQHVHV